jgi:hypothetical protein
MICSVADCEKENHKNYPMRCWIHRAKKWAQPIVEPVVAPIAGAIEQLWINKVKCTNKQSCFMPISKKARDKLYGDAHRAKLNAKSLEHYDANHEANLATRTAYRVANRDQLNAKKKEKIECECGVSYTRSHKARHLSTARHQASLQSA